MAKWIDRFSDFFNWMHKEEPKQYVFQEVLATPVVESKPELTEFQKVKAKFNQLTDMLVMGTDQLTKMSRDEIIWINSLGKKVYYFDNQPQIKPTIIRSR